MAQVDSGGTGEHRWVQKHCPQVDDGAGGMWEQTQQAQGLRGVCDRK